MHGVLPPESAIRIMVQCLRRGTTSSHIWQ